jgi:hypothetical protein
VSPRSRRPSAPRSITASEPPPSDRDETRRPRCQLVGRRGRRRQFRREGQETDARDPADHHAEMGPRHGGGHARPLGRWRKAP